jgi:S1-C subfamily serine protease
MNRWGVLAAILVVAGVARADEPSPSSRQKGPPTSFGKDAKLIITDGSMSSLIGRTALEQWRPEVAGKTRGGAEIFAKVAPATVVVRTEVGHGTGILISADGFILTNHHVIAEGMGYDPKRRASTAMVHLGRMNADGSIELAREPVEAVFYGADKNRDLALLRLAEPAAARGPLPFVSIADQGPRPGQSCSMVGHPAAGMLWTFRSCQVAAVGRSPGDMVDVVFQRLAAAGPEKHEIEASLASIPSRRIVLSSCEANPGDSGGPVVDDAGKLLAVTFAIPAQGDRSKFTYHVHLDEVKAFLAKRPTTPTVLTPDAWDLGPRVQLLGPEVLAAGVDRPEQFLFDLDGDTDPALLRSVDKSLVVGHKFEAEFALHTSAIGAVAFYDTDNDGVFDLIKEQRRLGGDVSQQTFTRRKDGSWDVQPSRGAVALVDPGLFVNPALGRRLTTLVRALGVK